MFYPELTDAEAVSYSNFLKLIRRKLQADPGYLEHSDCPYPEELVELLTELLVSTAAPVSEVIVASEELTGEDLNIENESLALYREMQSFRKNLDIDDVTEKAAMMRTSTSLLEKLLTIQEKAAGVRDFKVFTGVVMSVLDKYLEPTERTAFIEDLRSKLPEMTDVQG